jgi:hypothetical protein
MIWESATALSRTRGGMQNAGGCPPAFVAADEALGYAVRMRARAARRFSARRSSSLRPPQTP